MNRFEWVPDETHLRQRKAMAGERFPMAHGVRGAYTGTRDAQRR